MASLVCKSALRPAFTRLAFGRPVAVLSRRWLSETLAPPSPTKTFSPKIESLVNDISRLTLIETADLVALLKQRLNIADIPVFSGGAPSGAPAAAAAPVAEAKPAVVEKTEFIVKLESFDATNKVALIRAVKDLVKDLNLIAAKKFVEEAPKVLKESVSKEEAQKIKADLEKLGAKISVE